MTDLTPEERAALAAVKVLLAKRASALEIEAREAPSPVLLLTRATRMGEAAFVVDAVLRGQW